MATAMGPRRQERAWKYHIFDGSFRRSWARPSCLARRAFRVAQSSRALDRFRFCGLSHVCSDRRITDSGFSGRWSGCPLPPSGAAGFV